MEKIYAVANPMWYADTFIFSYMEDFGCYVYIKVNHANKIEEIGINLEKRMHNTRFEDMDKTEASRLHKSIFNRIGEEYWKAYTDYLLNSINSLESDDAEVRAIRREVRAKKKADEDYKTLLHSHNLLVKKHTELKQKVQELTAKLEGKPVTPSEEKRKNIRKRFAKLKNRKEIMVSMGFLYDENLPIAFNEVVFLEWASTNGKWEELCEKCNFI